MSDDPEEGKSGFLAGAIVVFVGFFIFYKCAFNRGDAVDKAGEKTEKFVVDRLKDATGINTIKKGLALVVETTLEKAELRQSDLLKLELELDAIDDINARAGNGNTLLLAFARARNDISDFDSTRWKSLLQKVLAQNPDINLPDSSENTPLIWATYNGTMRRRWSPTFDPHLYLFRKLLGREAAVHKKDRFGKTALSVACARGAYAYAELLIYYGALRGLSGEEINTLLEHSGSEEIRRLIREKVERG